MKMETILNPYDQQTILQRIELLKEDSKPQWGKMTSAQMLAHCNIALKQAIGTFKVKTHPLSIIGRLIKKTVLGPKPMHKNATTDPTYIVADPRNFVKEKSELLATFSTLVDLGEKGFKAEKHPFFGKMTKEEWARITFKHLDHHLRQFNC